MPLHSPHTPWRVISLRPRVARIALLFSSLCLLVLFGVVCTHTVLLVSGGVATLSRQFSSFVQGEETPPYPLQTTPPYTVALDPGHGGADPGAKALLNEVVVCEATVDALYTLLDADANYTPVRTRKNGENLSSSDRAKNANEARASLFLSVHANCDHGTGQSHGFECFPTPPGRLYSEQSMRFATYIAEKMGAAGHRLRGENGIRFAYYHGRAKQIVDSTDTRVRTQKSFGVVEKPLCPSVLAEQCFLTNSTDADTWASPEGCRRAARIYYEAICVYFGTQPQKVV